MHCSKTQLVLWWCCIATCRSFTVPCHQVPMRRQQKQKQHHQQRQRQRQRQQLLQKPANRDFIARNHPQPHSPSALAVESVPSTFDRDSNNSNNNSNNNDNDNSNSNDDREDENTVVSITNPNTGQTVTLIGTAHLSEKSSNQVQRLIETLRPDAVMIEIDPSRLERLGFESAGDIRVERVTDSRDIEVPASPIAGRSGVLGLAQRIFVGGFAIVARLLLTQMYKSMENEMDQKAGGEFLRAVRTAEDCDGCDTIILGDRDSVRTIQRVAEMAIESGDFVGVLRRLQAINKEELDKLEPEVRKKLLRQKGQEGNEDFELDEAELTTAMMETLKEDKRFRTRLFSKLERDVPEFTLAFLKERDYVMSESIRRELELRPSEVRNVVGVVGLAHVPGMEEHFRAVFAGSPAPLVRDLADAAAE